MITPSSLIKDDKPDAAAISAAPGDAAAIAAALADAHGPSAAALALLAGQHRVAAAQPALIALLDDDGFAGRAAGWALGQLDGSQDAVLAAIGSGSLDTRENGYAALATLAARGKASGALAKAMRARISAELERAKQKKTSLAEHALRVLAVLGEKDVPTLVTTLIDGDPLVDRVELQRLRTAVENDGRDKEGIRDLLAPWQQRFADDLYQAPVPAPAKAAAPGPSAKAPLAGNPKPGSSQPGSPMRGSPGPGAGFAARRPSAQQPPPPPAPAPMAPVADEDAELSDEERAEIEAELNAAAAASEGQAGEVQAKPVDWEAFSTSIEAQALPPDLRQLAKQLGGLLEQLCMRAVGVNVFDLRGQELAALLLQVMPQAVPPQMVQAALSPQGLNALQSVARHLTSAYMASADLVDGIKLVRKTLQAQMRRQGMLGGPDYSDPDDKPAPAPAG